MAISFTGITKAFGPNRVLRGIDLSIEPGEIVSLVGENGAGKSTLTRIVAGAYQPDAGQITIDGEVRNYQVPQDAMADGIQVIYQELRNNLFPQLDVAANLFAHDGTGEFGRLFVNKAKMHRRAAELLAQVGIKVDTRLPVGRLTFGEQQMVQIARCLNHSVRLLILDEPTAALDDRESEMLFRQVRKLQEAGVAIIYISHRLPEVFALADRIVVMRDGLVSLSGTPAELSEQQVVAAMVGGEVENFYPKEHHASDRVRLDVKDLRGSGFDGVSFQVHAGEVLGIGGVMGSGKGALLRALFGLDNASGSVRLDGQKISLTSPRHAIGDVLESRLLALGQLAGCVEAIRCVVRRIDRERAVLEPHPAGLLRRLVTRRRAAAEHRAVQAVAIEVLRGEKQVLRAGLAEHLEPACARRANGVDPFRGRYMNDQDRRIDEFGERDHAVDRLRLGAACVADRVIPRPRVAGADHLRGEPADHAVILGMHHRQCAVATRDSQHVENLLVREPHPVIGHEQLERTQSIADRSRQMIGERLLARVRDNQMECVVDHRFCRRPRVVVGEYVGDQLFAMLRGE